MGLVWLSVSAALVGFWLPWASFDLREPRLVTQLKATASGQSALNLLTEGLGRITATIRRGTETVTGTLLTLADIPKQVSGAQIPQLANQQNAQVAMALFELITHAPHHIGAKSHAVYLVPGMALLCGLLLTLAGRSRRVALGVTLGCAGIAVVGFWKLLTTDTKTLMVTVTIGPGVWLSLWAYVGLSLAALARAFVPRLR